MNNADFWALLNRGRESVQKLTELPSWIQEHLRTKPNEYLADYNFQYVLLLRASYDARLWAAATTIMKFCSDDKFEDFRAWLIAKGERFFYNAIQNPDALADMALDDGDFGQPILFKFHCVADDVYRERAGEFADLCDFMPRLPELVLLNGDLMNRELGEVAKMFPRLYARCRAGRKL